jgi:tripartite-type tricarboxylate transporter receptor subunit TctC
MNAPRRRFIRSLALLGGAATPLVTATGRSIRLLVGFPPGGGTDAIARLLAERLSLPLGAAVIVENRAGAGGQLAAQALKSAAPDGSTLLLSHDHTISILPLTVRDPGFDPARDFVPVAGFATFANAFAVSGAAPVRSFDAYLAWSRHGGGKGSVGVPAPASVPEFLVRAIGRKHRLDLEPAPYRGSAPMVADMIGGQIAAGVGSVPDLIEQHRAGRIHILAVIGTARQRVLPAVPTFAELGLAGFEELPYYGVFAPAGTPAATLEAFAAALARVLAAPDLQERLAAMGLAVGFMTGAHLAERERAYAKAWAREIAATGFRPQ